VDVAPNTSNISLTKPCVIAKIPINSKSSMETIPTSPTTTIQLNIEELPPIEVFYSPKHNSFLKKSRKKSKVTKTCVLTITTTLQAPSLEIVCKGTSTILDEELE